MQEEHLLDDVSFEIVKKRHERIRLGLAILSGILQLIGWYIVLYTHIVPHFLGAYYFFVCFGIVGLTLILQWRYRAPEAPEREIKI
jgi:hypothetical protein